MFQLCVERVEYVMMKSVRINGKRKVMSVRESEDVNCIRQGNQHCFTLMPLWYKFINTSFHHEQMKTRSREVLLPVLR